MSEADDARRQADAERKRQQRTREREQQRVLRPSIIEDADVDGLIEARLLGEWQDQDKEAITTAVVAAMRLWVRAVTRDTVDPTSRVQSRP